MKLAILGTGMVGQAIATKLVSLGHSVMMGSRTADNEAATSWAAAHSELASSGAFAEAAAVGELVFNCTNGNHSLEALEQTGADNLSGKVLIDVANTLDFSSGAPVFAPEAESLGEQIQAAYSDTRVVKTLNTINCDVMVAPNLVPGEHAVFMSGNDAAAKATVRELLESFGWREIIDLGGIETARGTEFMMPQWLSLMGHVGHARFNYQVRVGEKPE